MNKRHQTLSELPSGQRYSHRSSPWFQILIALIVGPVGLLWTIDALMKSQLIAALAYGCGTIYVAALAWRGYMENSCHLILGEQGVYVIAFNKVRTAINWAEVQRIERSRWSTWDEGLEYHSQITIIGVHGAIPFGDDKQRSPALLEHLTRIAHQHNIQLFLIDKGEDTMKKAKARIKDKNERKKVNKEGVRTILTSL